MMQPERQKAKVRLAHEWLRLGVQHCALGNYEAAIASFDIAIEIKPDYDSAWYNRGSALGKLGRYEEAVTSYKKAYVSQTIKV